MAAAKSYDFNLARDRLSKQLLRSYWSDLTLIINNAQAQKKLTGNRKKDIEKSAGFPFRV